MDIIIMCRIIDLNLIWLMVVGVVLVNCVEKPYLQVIHNTDPKARCLDGSSPALYIHEGGESNKFLIFFTGGQYCVGTTMQQVLQSCYKRSKTELGSSKYLPPTITADGGYLSTDPALSQFATWTKIFITYCDGSLHQGSTQNAYKYKDTELYFRGADNTRSHLIWLVNNKKLASAEKVLLTGASAGGIATYLWSNYVKRLLVNPQALYTVPDSGVFMNAPSPASGLFKLEINLSNLMKVSNVNQKTPLTQCNRAKLGQQYKCLFFQNACFQIQGRLLLINSEYDSYAISHILDITCLKDGASGSTLSGCNSSQLANIENYRSLFLNYMSFYHQIATNSLWTISCSNHVYAAYGNMYDVASQKVPQSSGLTVRNAIEKFVINDERISSVDKSTWPDNSACAM